MSQLENVSRFLSEIGSDEKIDEKTKDFLTKKMLKENNVSPLVLLKISRFVFCDRFGCLPSQLKKEEVRDINEFNAIINGINSVSQRKLKR